MAPPSWQHQIIINTLKFIFMAKSSFNLLQLLSCATDYAFNAKFNQTKFYNCNAFNRHIDEMLTDFLKSSFKNLPIDSQVVYLKAFMVKYLL